MKTTKYDSREEWLEARKGKITGSRLKEIVVKRGTGQKIGYYELIAERIAIAPDGENPMDRGTRLEEESLARLEKETGKKFDTSLVIWEREDNRGIAISPDGFRGVTEAAESKSLSSALHIKAYLTKQIPDEYEFQKVQYFIVNDKLKKLYFCFYDPRMPEHLQFFFIEVTREEVQEAVDEYLAYQKNILREVEEIVTKLTF